MGKRGPKPEPMEVRQAKGSHRGRGAKAAEKAVKGSGVPQKPSGLVKDAAAIWDRTLPLLLDLCLVDESNTQCLVNYCHAQAILDAYNRYEASKRGYQTGKSASQSAFNARQSMIEATTPGHYNTAIKEARAEVHRYETALGLTPADRGSINRAKGQPGEGLQKIDGQSAGTVKLGARLTG